MQNPIESRQNYTPTKNDKAIPLLAAHFAQWFCLVNISIFNIIFNIQICKAIFNIMSMILPCEYFVTIFWGVMLKCDFDYKLGKLN